MPVYVCDYESPMCGVSGRLVSRTTKPGRAPGLWCQQIWVSESRPVASRYGKDSIMRVKARYDDELGNGHNTFSITAEVTRTSSRKRGGYYTQEDIAGGCLHDDIAMYFPELAHLIPWHLVSSEGPMHYIANTVYLAGDRDYNGLRAGETRPLLGPDGVPRWELVAENTLGVGISDTSTGRQFQDSPTVPLYILIKECKGEAPPLATPRLKWQLPTTMGKGKARELEAARRVAVWPDATDAELCAEPDTLRAMLRDRLPGLLARFRAEMDFAGFYWTPVGLIPVRG